MTNEPAFPVAGQFYGDGILGGQLHHGMTLRDYFAAQAMQGLLAQSCGTAGGSPVEEGAYYAYKMADAMLAEREKGNSK